MTSTIHTGQNHGNLSLVSAITSRQVQGVFCWRNDSWESLHVLYRNLKTDYI